MNSHTPLSILNQSPVRLPGPDLLHNLVSGPSDSTALDHLQNGVQTTLSYHDLHRTADAIAHQIRRNVTVPGGEEQFVVPVLIEQSPLLYASLLGILKAGGAFCPLNLDAPPERVSFILQDVSAQVVLVSDEQASKIPDGLSAKPLVVRLGESDHAFVEAAPSFSVTTDRLAYVMYTSGSTGTPKGVGISHAAATQALLAHDRHVPSFSRFLQFAAPTFDVSVFEIFFPLFRGSTLVSVRRAEMLDNLPVLMSRMQVDACELTPSVAGSLLRTRANVPGLRLLLTIGEMLSEPVIREFGGDDERESILWAMYGPTEATIHCTLQPAMSSQSAVGGIGFPLDTVSAFVIAPHNDAEPPSEDLRILPRGESGELAVGGHQLAEGYLNRPEQTASAFLDSPYGRIYRTGDKARILQDGTLECLGRLSEGQVKLRGQRIELGEVEAAVVRTRGCHGAQAVVHESILICFCAVDENVSEKEVASSCERWLPRYMVPGEFVVVREFPRLPSGKVDKKKLLADLVASRHQEDTASELQRWKLGQFPDEIQDIMTDMIRTRSSATEASPLASGLDSLTAIRLASSLRTCRCDISASEILKLRSMEALHAIMVERFGSQTPGDSYQLPDLLPGDLDDMVLQNPRLSERRQAVEAVFPCTPLQRAMISESMQHPGTYWNEVELVAEAGLTEQQIMKALDQLTQSSEILRTGFAVKGDEVVSVLFRHLDRQPVTVLTGQEWSRSPPAESFDLLTPWTIQIKSPTDPEGGLRLLINMHHSIYDGWSLDMMISDMSDLVRGLSPPVRPPFRNVAAFHFLRNDEATRASKQYWAESLNGWSRPSFPKLCESVNVDNSRSSTATQGVINIAPGKVKEASAAIGCSPQVLFQACLVQVWSAILGNSDIVIGTVTSGRAIPVAGVELVLGPCIASMPLRADLTKISDTSHLLNHIQASNRAMMEHNMVSLSDIRKLVGIQPGESLYDVLFVYQESPGSQHREEHAFKEVRHLDRLETKLVVEVEPRADSFSVQMTYHLGSFAPGLVDLILGQVRELVCRLVQQSSRPVLTWSRGLDVSPSTYNLHAPRRTIGTDLATMFEEAARRTPEASAICLASRNSDDGRMSLYDTSYAELDELSNRICHLIRAHGVGPNRIIAVVLDKSVLLYASILAVVKAGCAYLPLLPSTPTERMRTIFAQANITTCLADSSASRTLMTLIPELLTLDVETEPLTELPSRRPRTTPPVDGSMLAYVIFTSGSTGEPKGVPVSQRNIVSNILHLGNIYPKSETKQQSRLLQACSQAFDVSVFEIFYTWYMGMCLCTGTNDVLLEDLEHSIRELEATHLSLTPTVASLIDPLNVPDVEFLVTAGEPMTQSVLDRWGSKLWQGYGPSETTNICSVKRMHPDYHIEHLGWTFPNTSVVVLVPGSLDVAPMGWIGEFCFLGDQVIDGYLNLPQITARSFIQHREFGRLYRSGDMGRMLPDGSLVILGRVDSQLKLRGQRIEAGEIECIMTTTGLASSAVVTLVRRQEVAANQLVAFYSPPGGGHSAIQSSDADVDIETHRRLVSALQSKLPPYMVPTYLVPVQSIRLTSSGKVDYRGLREWFTSLASEEVQKMVSQDAAASGNEEGDWSEAERTVAQAVSTSLGIPITQINRWTPFVTLGLDSVTSIGLARHLKDVFGTRVPISAILRNPNVASLASYIFSSSSSESVWKPSESVPFFPDTFVEEVRARLTREAKIVSQVLPCTPLQEAMLSSGQASYYNKVMLRLQIPVGRMRAYWAEMVRRHGILRTCFVATSDANYPIAQVVLEGWSISWHEFDVVAPSFDEVVNEHLSTLPNPVDSLAPPISLAEIRYRGSTFVSFICHHSLYDGIAMDNLWREVEALANDRPLAPAVSYELFLKQSLRLPDDVEAFWKGQLVDWRPANLFRKQRSKKRTDQVTTTTYLNKSLSTLRNKLQGMGISLLALCQAAWANTLAIAHNGPDVCFGNVVDGRSVDIEDIDRLVAPCFNTIPLRKDLSLHIHRMDLIKSFQALGSAVMPYQFTPLRLVQKVANRQGLGLFETLLLLQHPLRDMDDKVWILEGDSSEMNIPLVCEVVPCPGLDSIVVDIHHDMNVVTPDVATTLAAIFVSQLEEMMDSPYANLTTRETLASGLKDGLAQLAPRREKKPVVIMTRAAEPSSSVSVPVADEWTDVELVVRNVLSELSNLPVTRISKHTTIFQLGLDSINAVQVAVMLSRRGLSTSASDVMECPSCDRLAERLALSKQQRSTPASRDGSGMTHYDLKGFQDQVSSQLKPKLAKDVEIESILPCTPLQSAMLVSFVESEGHNYLNRMTYDLDPRIEQADVVRAWTTLYAAHPMLRTGFVAINHKDSPFAMVRHAASASAGGVPLTTIQLADVASLNASLGKFQDSLRWEYVQMTNLHKPLWHVLLADIQGTISMTLFMHHSLYDADSLAALLQALNRLLSSKEEPAVLGFANIEDGLVEVMAESLSLSGHAEAEAFWTKKKTETVVNPFPVLTPLRETVSRALKAVTVDSALSFSALKTATLGAGVTVQAALQGAWARILTGYIGETSVTFGVTVSGRTTGASRSSPLPCLSTLPVIVTNQPSNRALLDSMMSFNASVHRFHGVPLSQVQKWLGHPASPVFDTLLSYRKVDERRGHGDKQLLTLVSDVATIDYPVSVEVEAIEGAEVRLTVTYKPDIVPEEQVKLMLQQFDAILCHLALHPAETEDDLHSKSHNKSHNKSHQNIFSVLPPAIPIMEAPVRYLHEFVERTAALQPDAAALEFCSSLQHQHDEGRRQSWTYREFNEMGNRVAHCLRMRTGVTPGSIVAVHFDKCPEAYFSILGILKAGCAFVALDPHAPQARKAFIMQDSQASCLLVGGGDDVEAVDFAGQTEVIQITTHGLLDQYPPSPYAAAATFDGSYTCYCLYTSGTTGTPKGCEITHDNAVQAMMAFQELFRGHWQPDSRWLQFAALHFDVSVLEQYWSWAVGITVVAAPKDLILDDLTGSINALGITHIDLTPSLARLTHPDSVPNLCRGVFITGGESLKQEILDVWGPQAVIYNAYGPTEATIGVTMYQRVPANGRPSNIGKQFPNVGSFVFRPGTELPVLRGAVGELCVSGKLVGKGYLGRPELTKERFPTLVSDPFRGERVYRTGDLVRVLHDGCFEFLGRADDQIKLRGQRLEIGEINHAMKQVPEIHDVATIVASKNGGGVGDEKNESAVLVAFVVAASARAQESEKRRQLEVLHDDEEEDDHLGSKAREACRSKLPGYMVPSYFLRVPFIPLSANNKAEVKELRRLFDSIPPARLMQLNAPRAMTEHKGGVAGQISQTILATLAEFSGLNADDLHPTMSIFDAGVDSISALRLTHLLKDRGLKMATPALVLRNPLISDLARALSPAAQRSAMAAQNRQNQEKQQTEARQLIKACRHRYRALACKELGVRLDEIEYIAPCSPLQQGMLSRSLTNASEGLYFNTFALRLQSEVSTEKLKAAFESLVASEAILRTVFLPTAEGSIQVAMKELRVPWAAYAIEDGDDHQSISISERTRSEWLAVNKTHVIQPLQLVLLEGRQTRKLLVYIFHALYDGISLDLMLNRVAKSVTETDEEEPRRDAAPSFVEALAHGPLWKFEECRGFWEKHLQGFVFSPLSSLLLNYAPPEEQKRVSSARRGFDYNELDKVRKARGITLQAVMLALWTSVLQQQQPIGGDLTLGIVVSGRSIELDGIESTIGPLFNTLPFRVKKNPRQTWSGRLRECHDFLTSVLPFQHAPLHRIQKWCSGGQPLFDNLFTLHYTEKEDSPGPDSPRSLWEEVVADDGELSLDYPLALEVSCKRDGRLELFLATQGHLADDATLGSLLDEWVHSAQKLVADPDALLANPEIGATTVLEMAKTQMAENSKENNTQVSEKSSTDRSSWSIVTSTICEEAANLSGLEDNDVDASMTMLELGLDSIDLIKLSARLKVRDIVLPASKMMQLQSIVNMAAAVEDQQAGFRSPKIETKTEAEGGVAIDAELDDMEGRLEAAARQSVSDYFADLQHQHQHQQQQTVVEQILPPTSLQESMVGAMIQSDFAWYFNHDVAELQDGVNMGQLRRAWEQVVEAHPILRTGFVEVHDEKQPPLDVTYSQVVFSDAEPWKGEFQASDLEEGASILFREATDMAKSGRGVKDLVQIRSLVLADGRRFLLLSLAHALYDGWSLGLIHLNVWRAYHGEPLESPSYPDQFRTLVRKEQRREPESKQFWSEYLQGAAPTIIPSVHYSLEGSLEEPRGESVDDSVDESVEEDGAAVWRAERPSSHARASIAAFCRSQRVTLQVLCQACWAVVLATRTRQLDVVFGMVVSGRDNLEGAEELVFPTMNTIASRCILHGTVGDLLRYLEEQGRQIRLHQGYPLRKVTNKGDRATQVTGMSLFNSLFMLQKTVAASEGCIQESPLTVSVTGSSAVDYPVCVEAEIINEDLVWRVACQSHVMKGNNDVTDLLDQLEQVLTFFVSSSPEADVLEFTENGVSVCGLKTFTLDAYDETEEEAGSSRDEAESFKDEEQDTVKNQAIFAETARVVRDVLSQVSGVPVGDIKDSHTLYHLGLDSISAIKVSTILRKRSVGISVRNLIKATSIRDMIAQVVASATTNSTTDTSAAVQQEAKAVYDDHKGEDDDYVSKWLTDGNIHALVDQIVSSENGLEISDIAAAIPALPMQVYMLGVWQNTAGAVFYPEFAFEVRRRCDEGEVWRAWRAVVDATPILRTCLVSTERRDLPVLQLILKPDAVRRQQQQQEEGMLRPMVHMAPERAANGESWVIRLRIHHALYDGVSLPAIMKRLAQLLGAGDRVIMAEEEAGVGGTVITDDDKDAWTRYCIRPTLEAAKAERRQFWMDNLGRRPSVARREEENPPPQTESRDVITWGSGGGDINQGRQAQSGTEGRRNHYPIERACHIKRSALSPRELQLLQKAAAAHGVGLQSLFLAAWARYLVDAGSGLAVDSDAPVTHHAHIGPHRGAPGLLSGQTPPFPTSSSSSSSSFSLGTAPATSADELAADSAAPPHGSSRRAVVFGMYRANRMGDNGDEDSTISTTGTTSSTLDVTFPRLNLVPLRVEMDAAAHQQNQGRGRTLWDVAGKVQEGLARMSPSHCQVGLWEVEAWTGWRMESFVNFLSLPVEDDDDDPLEDTLDDHLQGDESVTLTALETPLAAEEGVGSRTASCDGLGDIPLGDVPVRDVLPPAVDIEASVNGGALDIGVFGPESGMLQGGVEAAQGIVAALVEILRETCQH